MDGNRHGSWIRVALAALVGWCGVGASGGTAGSPGRSTFASQSQSGTTCFAHSHAPTQQEHACSEPEVVSSRPATTPNPSASARAVTTAAKRLRNDIMNSSTQRSIGTVLSGINAPVRAWNFDNTTLFAEGANRLGGCSSHTCLRCLRDTLSVHDSKNSTGLLALRVSRLPARRP